MDNLTITKIWSDENEPFFEVRITAHTDIITVYTDCYASVAMFREIKDKITHFADEKPSGNEISVDIGTDNMTSVHIKITGDRAGHILFDITMILDDDSEPKHKCSFYLKTETGLLERFADSLMYLAEAPVDAEISLIQD